MVVAIAHSAALFYSWIICYIVNRAPVTAALPAHGKQDMNIDLELGKQPPSGKLYPLSPDELELQKGYLDEMLKNGKIRLIKSTAATPIFFAKQANGKLRIVVDYRGLNAITMKDKYPLPIMTTLMEQVGTLPIFSKLDIVTWALLTI